eukprot:scaffold225995_cov26-Tisochrysis_lutea.AAC.1
MFQRAHFALSLTNHSTGADEMEQLEAHTRADEMDNWRRSTAGSAFRKAALECLKSGQVLNAA